MEKFNIPKPPSTNHIYAFTSRRGFAQSYITRAGRVWFDEGLILVQSQRKNKLPITDKVFIKIKLFTAYRNDVDNINKPILDLLAKHAQVIENDIQVFKLETEKFPCKKTQEHVEIEILPYTT